MPIFKPLLSVDVEPLFFCVKLRVSGDRRKYALNRTCPSRRPRKAGESLQERRFVGCGTRLRAKSPRCQTSKIQ